MGSSSETASPTKRDILNLLVKCKVDAANNPSFQYRRSLTRNTGLLSYLAADKQKRVAVFDYVCTLLRTDQEVPPAQIVTYARADPNELPTKDDCLVHDSKGTYRGPLETPLIEAVMNEWEEMVFVPAKRRCLNRCPRTQWHDSLRCSCSLPSWKHDRGSETERMCE